MSIDKNSTGLPGINVHKSSTKVNLWMVAAILVFLSVTAVLAIRASRNHDPAIATPPAVNVKE